MPTITPVTIAGMPMLLSIFFASQYAARSRDDDICPSTSGRVSAAVMPPVCQLTHYLTH